MTLYEILRDRIRAEAPVALATVIEGPNVGAKLLVEPGREPLGTLGHPDLDRVVARDTLAELEAGRTGVRHYGVEGQANPDDPAIAGCRSSSSRSRRLRRCGSSAPSTSPPRWPRSPRCSATASSSATPEGVRHRARFPMADEVLVSWPGPVFDERGKTLGPRDAVCVLTHDPKFDVPAIEGALGTNVGYIGVMGSRRTHERRMERLAEVGIVDPADMARLMSPIGLDLGARTPEETAISICAEIIARRTGRMRRRFAMHPARSTPHRGADHGPIGLPIL